MPDTDGPRRALLETAERLYAERGIEGVSLRDIASAAGNRNNSAVQYHFGDREGLLRAIFRFRMEAIDATRRELLTRLDESGAEVGVRELVEVGLRPLTDFLASEPEGGHYAQFIARVSPTVDFSDPEFADVADANREVVGRLIRALPRLSPPAALERIDLMYNMSISALAIFEQRRAAGIPVVAASYARTVEHLIDMAVGALTADPMSAE